MERSGHLGWGGWQGEPEGGACHVRPAKGVPDPDPPMPSRQKGAKGLGRRDRRHRQRRRDCGQGTRPVLTSGLIIQKPCRENKRKCKREGEKKEREIMRVRCGPQHHTRPAGRGNQGSPGAPPHCPNPSCPAMGCISRLGMFSEHAGQTEMLTPGGDGASRVQGTTPVYTSAGLS